MKLVSLFVFGCSLILVNCKKSSAESVTLNEDTTQKPKVNTPLSSAQNPVGFAFAMKAKGGHKGKHPAGPSLMEFANTRDSPGDGEEGFKPDPAKIKNLSYTIVTENPQNPTLANSCALSGPTFPFNLKEDETSLKAALNSYYEAKKKGETWFKVQAKGGEFPMSGSMYFCGSGMGYGDTTLYLYTSDVEPLFYGTVYQSNGPGNAGAGVSAYPSLITQMPDGSYMDTKNNVSLSTYLGHWKEYFAKRDEAIAAGCDVSWGGNSCKNRPSSAALTEKQGIEKFSMGLFKALDSKSSLIFGKIEDKVPDVAVASG